jgi:hypothetical protein
MRPPALLALPLAAAAALATAAPAPAATISRAGVRFARLAVNADGATVVAWERASRGAFGIEAREGARPGALARTQRLSPKGYQPLVAVGDDGTKAVMWIEPGARGTNTVRAAIARPGHRFGTPRTVRRQVANLSPIAVAVQPTGRVVAIWSRGRTAAAALARRGHAFGRPQSLGATSGTDVVSDPRDGSVIVQQGPSLILPGATQPGDVRTLSPAASSFSAPLPGPSTGAALASLSGLGPVLVAGPGGVAAVATAMTNDATAIVFTRRAADGTWAPPALVATIPFVEATFVEGVTAALPADGSAVVAWSLVTEVPSGLGGNLGSQTFASVAGPSAAFGATQPLTAGAPHRFGFPSVAAAGDEAFVASAEPHGSVVVSSRTAGATTLAPPATLTSSGDGDVVLAAGGRNVVAVYQRQDRLRLKIVR